MEKVRCGVIGVGGSTGAVLNRTLVALRELIARSIEDVRLTTGVKNRKPIRVSDFIAVLWNGKIVESGPKEELFDSENRFVSQFLNADGSGPLAMD